MKSFFAVAAVIISSPLLSQTPSDTTRSSMQEVVVTANKFPKRQSETGKVITVIGRDIISKNEGRTLTSLLNQQAGITIVGAQSNLGTNQDVYVRGAAVGKTLILIDGIPAYDASTISQAFDLNHISLQQVERIEIVKGALSTLYGSDAVAGVINIITRKGGNRPLNVYGTLAAGSFDTYKGALGIGGTSGKIDYNVQYTGVRSKGFSAAEDTAVVKSFDKDGYRQDIVRASIGTVLSSRASLRLYGQYGRYKTDLDYSAYKDDRDFTVTNFNYQAGLNATVSYGAGTLYFNYNYNATERAYLNDSGFINPAAFATYETQNYKGRSHFIEAYTRVGLGKYFDLLGGVDFRLQQTDQYYHSESSFGPYTSELNGDSLHANQYSVFASLVLKQYKGFNAEVGGRLNHHEAYGNNFTYTFNPSYLISKDLKVFANLASAFKAPTLYQLFSSGKKINLEPETSVTIEGGLQYALNSASWVRALYFNRDTKNGIDYNLATNMYFNYPKQEDHGIEVEGMYRGSRLFAQVNYTYVTGKTKTLTYEYNPATFGYDVKGDTSFNNLFRRPAHSINATVGYDLLPALYASVSAKYVGKREEGVFGGSPIALDDYTTLDFYTEYRLSRFKLFVDLKNITDKKFTEVVGYSTAGFNFMAGVTFNFSK